LGRYVKHSTQYLTTFPNTWKFVKNTELHTAFSTLLTVFGNVVKHGLSCLIYYFKVNKELSKSITVKNPLFFLIGVVISESCIGLQFGQLIFRRWSQEFLSGPGTGKLTSCEDDFAHLI